MQPVEIHWYHWAAIALMVWLVFLALVDIATWRHRSETTEHGKRLDELERRLSR